MYNFIKKATRLYLKASYCLASAEIYLCEAEHAKH